jgi:hypothetical protein
MMGENVIVFPVRHRGDPDPRRFALAALGFRWRGGLWRRGRVVLTDADIDAMEAPAWEQSLHRWTRRRPRARG